MDGYVEGYSIHRFITAFKRFLFKAVFGGEF